jgi:hypothetical protein
MQKKSYKKKEMTRVIRNAELLIEIKNKITEIFTEKKNSF